MFRKVTRITLAAMALAFAFPLQATIIYVNVNATGSNTGSSWANAFTSLQSGIGASFPGDTIWVAQGVYKPTTTTSRTVTFLLPDAVKIFGGFNGTETSITQQNVSGNVTTLSGDIGVTGNATDNTFHILTATNISNASLLDGFRVVSGNTTGMITGSNLGAGLMAGNSSIVVRNCTFQSNVAEAGAAIASGGGGNISFINCTVINNTASGTGANGGAIRISGGTANFQGCRIMSNSGYSGGGFRLSGGIINIDRCDISGNTANGSGGAIQGFQNNFTLTLTNSLIAGNTSGDDASAIMCISIPANVHRVINCTVSGNSSVPGSDGCCMFSANAQVNNCVFFDNYEAITLDGNNMTTNNNLIQGVNLTSPMFIAPGSSLLAPFTSAGYNYRVAAFSPVVNYGSATNLIPIYNADLDNNPRTQGPAPDAGCYENSGCTFNLDISSNDSSAICPGTSTTLNASAGSVFQWTNNATTSSITVNSAGTYTLVADSAGCLGNASYTVSLLPAAVNISEPSGLCPGITGTLYATGTNISSYTWTGGSTADSLLITAPGTYIVSVTTTEGCNVADTVNVTAFTAPNPVVSFNTPVLSTGSFTTYQWLLNGNPIVGANAAQYTALQDGNYSVVVTNASGCSDTSAIYTIIALGITNADQTVFTLYPNPSSGSISLVPAADASQLQLRVLDLQGRVVFSEIKENVRSTQPVTVDMNALADGVYMLQLQSGSFTHTAKIVIRH